VLRVSLDAVGGPNIVGHSFLLVMEEAEADFVLPLRTPVAHMTRWNMRSP
jgi:hypothetical protein